MTEQQPDTLHRFLIDDANVRGELVHLDASWQSILACSDYPPAIRKLLGDAMAATALMSATIKFSGKLTLQVRGSGPVNLLVMQSHADGAMRGLAHWQSVPNAHSLRDFFGDDGRMLITIDPGEDGEQYQGIVELQGENLSEALGNYFSSSEQLPTTMYLFSDECRAVGLLLQKLPGDCDDTDGWERSQQLAETATGDEALSLSAESLLHRLFHQENLRLFEGKPVRFECSCSRERTEAMIQSLGQSEADDIIKEQGSIEVICEFCNTRYVFDAVDVGAVFDGVPSLEAGAIKH